MSVYKFEMDMTCEGCANAAKKVLDKLGDKVTDVQIDYGTKMIQLKSSMPKEEVLEQLKKTGKDVQIKE